MQSYELEQTTAESLQSKGRKGKALLWAVLVSSWSVIIILPIAMALVSIFIIYGKEEVLISPTDQYPIEPISKTMCRYMHIESTKYVTMVLMNYPPPENGGVNNVTSPRLALELASNKPMKSWKFYLTEFSNVTFHLLKPVVNVTFIIIQGEDNHEKWADSKGKCTTCITHEYSLNHSVTSLPFYAKETGLYYFIFKPQKYCEDQLLPYRIYIQRRTFHLDSNHVCFYAKFCSFDMFPKTFQRIYIDYEDLEEMFRPIRLTLSCHPREWIYFVCCGFLPLVAGFVITSVAMAVHKSYERHVAQQLTREEEERYECPEMYFPPAESPPDQRRRFVPHLSDIEEVTSTASCDSNSPLLARMGPPVAKYAINSTTDGGACRGSEGTKTGT